MASPVPMPCLKDECPSPFRCHSAGSCIEAQRDGYLSHALAIAECRERRVIPKSWKRDEAS